MTKARLAWGLLTQWASGPGKTLARRSARATAPNLANMAWDGPLELREEAGHGSATAPPVAAPATGKKNNSGAASAPEVRSGDALFPPGSVSSAELREHFAVTLEIRDLLRVIAARLPTSGPGLMPLDDLDVRACAAEGFTREYELAGGKSWAADLDYHSHLQIAMQDYEDIHRKANPPPIADTPSPAGPHGPYVASGASQVRTNHPANGESGEADTPSSFFFFPSDKEQQPLRSPSSDWDPFGSGGASDSDFNDDSSELSILPRSPSPPPSAPSLPRPSSLAEEERPAKRARIILKHSMK